MCLAKHSTHPSWWYEPPDPPDAEFPLQPPTTIPVLDDIFKLSVVESPTAERCRDIDVQHETVRLLRMHQVLHIVPLRLATRDFPRDDAAGFWLRIANSDSWISPYYQRSYWQEGLQTYTSEPCTAVVDDRVVLCIELFFELSNVILYRDILASLDETLHAVLARFNAAQRFPPRVSYTYMQHSERDGWFVTPLDQGLLSMPFRALFLQPSVLNSNQVDFFRLSPAGVCESSVCGVFECAA